LNYRKEGRKRNKENAKLTPEQFELVEKLEKFKDILRIKEKL